MTTEAKQTKTKERETTKAAELFTPKEAAAKIENLLAKFDQAETGLKEVTGDMLDIPRLRRLFAGALSREQKLLLCEPQSLFRCVRNAGQLGLEFNSALHHCQILPFWNSNLRGPNQGGYEAQLVIEYRGYVHLVTRDGRCSAVSGETVYERDEFDYDLGTAHFIHHKKYHGKEDRGDIIAWYVLFHMAAGPVIGHIETVPEINRIREMAPASNSPAWKNHYAEQGLAKTIKRGLKRVPQSVVLANAVQIDTAAEIGEASAARMDTDIIDVEYRDETADAVKAKAEEKKEKPATGVGAIITKYGLDEDQGKKLIGFTPRPNMQDVEKLFEQARAKDIDPLRYLDAFDKWDELKAGIEKDLAAKDANEPKPNLQA